MLQESISSQIGSEMYGVLHMILGSYLKPFCFIFLLAICSYSKKLVLYICTYTVWLVALCLSMYAS